MKTGWIALILSWHLPTLCQAQPVQQVTMVNPKNGEYSYGTIYNPNYYQQLNNQNSGPSVLEVILNASQKSDELEWKKKMAAQQEASRKAAAKRASDSAKQTAEMVMQCQKMAEQIYDMYDRLKGLSAWDDRSLAFRKKIGDFIADDPWQAALTLIELEDKMKAALAEKEKKRLNEEYQKMAEANRPKGFSERVKNAYNALFNPNAPTSKSPPTDFVNLPYVPQDNFGFIPDPVQPKAK